MPRGLDLNSNRITAASGIVRVVYDTFRYLGIIAVTEDASLRRRIVIDILRVSGLVCFGTTGFMVVERWDFIDSLYMTVTTMTTVGYGEVHPLSYGGKIFTITFILFSVAVAAYVLSDIVQALMSFDLRGRRMKEKIVKLKGHQIVCGFGRTGQEVCDQFRANSVLFVVIETEASLVKKAEELGYLVIQGDASEDDILTTAQIQNAKGVVCALPDDSTNTFITLTAKGFNENITIVSRASNAGSESKLRRAGAHMVISPYTICGQRLATSVTHPLVTEFLDVVMHAEGYDLRMEQVSLGSASDLVGAALKDASIKQTSGAMILAVRQDGKLMTNPSPEIIFQAGDELIALGTAQQLKKLSELAYNRHD
jgi:voltage-gated potassium channel